MQKPSVPKGTRDSGPADMMRRNYIFDIIKNVFTRYGYKQIETPAMENLSTLLGKYGEEGDRLIYRVTNSANLSSDKFNSADRKDLVEELIYEKVLKQIIDKFGIGLRYDLTVPFARYVVMHQNDITFPFKRFQIQPVWRADRPQKGRYREFYQCDVDVIGSDSLLNELELIQIVDDIFSRLNINVLIKLNNRKILSGIADFMMAKEENLIDITVAIDKLSKIGIDEVNNELRAKGLSDEAIRRLHPLLELKGDAAEKMRNLKLILSGSYDGLKGIKEMETLFNYLSGLKLKSDIELDLSLARGLNYYTGTIFEVVARNAAIGSIAGGGRYDDLTGIFGLKDVSGVGISFGADRISDVMNELKLFPAQSSETTKVLFLNFGIEEEKYCLPLLAEAREKGINAEIYPDQAKIKKQMDYANANNIPFVIIIGSEEIKSSCLTLKDMKTGKQQTMKFEELLTKLS